MLPCAAIHPSRGLPEWLARPAFDQHLAAGNAAEARAAAEAEGPPAYSRWIERVNKELPGRAAPAPRPGEEESCKGERGGAVGADEPVAAVVFRVPRAVRAAPEGSSMQERARRAYQPLTALPRGFTLDVLA